MKRNTRGFSLVEMAVVLIIFGLVLASASSVLMLFVNKGGAERTRKMIDANKNVLFSIAASDGYLQDTPIESRAANAGTSYVTYPADAYGKGFHVMIDGTLGYTDEKDRLDYSPVCGTDRTVMSLRLCNDDECSSPAVINDIAFVLVSGSANKNIQTDADSGVVTVYTQGDDGIDDYSGDMDRPEMYDDITDWATLPELRTQAGCEPRRLRLLDTSMPMVREGEWYSFRIYAEGGVPFRQSAVSETVPEYDFTLVDKGGLTFNFRFFVKGETSDSELTLGVPGRGEYLMIEGNTTPVGTEPYLVKILVEDDSSSVSGGSGNSLTRTLYIKPQE